MFRQRTPATLGVAVVMLLSGCAAKMVTTPEIQASPNADVRLQGKILYDGNREYLPRMLADASIDPIELGFRYSYDVKYGRDSVPRVLPLFNPLTIVGFPIGEDTLAVEAHLAILKGEEVIKTYTAACLLESTRNIFWPGETYSELRRKGLMAVRDNIENQMLRDREFLSTLSTIK